MSIIFFICFLLFATSSVLSVHDDDERALLKMKKQLGDPDVLQRWVKGYNFCQLKTFDEMFAGPVYSGCSSTGRVDTLIMQNIQNVATPFPDAICDLIELEYLLIYNFPELYGEIPSCMTKLMNLFTFRIQVTSLTGPVPSFYNQTKLRDIILEYSHLSGSIPQSLSTLPNLNWLHLTSNNLSGAIPPGLLHNSPSPSLLLAKNNLSGEIPKCYGRINFQDLDLSDNRLSGDASFLFSKDKSYSIMLGNNAFEFDLSSVEISQTKDIYILNISHNKIYGKVPDSFVKYGIGTIRDLSNNRLCGELPKNNRFDPQDVANNLCLCGNPLPPCSGSSFAPPPF